MALNGKGSSIQAGGRDVGSPCAKLTSLPQLEIMAYCPSASSSVLLCMECLGSLPNCPCDFLGPRILPHLPSTASHTNWRDTGQPHSRCRKAQGASPKTDSAVTHEALALLLSFCGDSGPYSKLRREKLGMQPSVRRQRPQLA